MLLDVELYPVAAYIMLGSTAYLSFPSASHRMISFDEAQTHTCTLLYREVCDQALIDGRYELMIQSPGTEYELSQNELCFQILPGIVWCTRVHFAI